MQVNLSIKDTLDSVKPFLDALGPKKAAFATSDALNMTAGRVERAIRMEMEKSFDRPTPFTLNAIYTWRSTPRTLNATVRLRDSGSNLPPIKWLSAQVYGGDRNAKRSENLLMMSGIMPQGYRITPGPGAPLDAYGNVPGSFVSQLLSWIQAYPDSKYNSTPASRKRRAKKWAKQGSPLSGFFVVPVGNNRGLKPGIYSRSTFAHGRGVKPVFWFVPRATYRPRLKFFETAQDQIERYAADDAVIAIEREARYVSSNAKNA